MVSLASPHRRDTSVVYSDSTHTSKSLPIFRTLASAHAHTLGKRHENGNDLEVCRKSTDVTGWEIPVSRRPKGPGLLVFHVAPSYGDSSERNRTNDAGR